MNPMLDDVLAPFLQESVLLSRPVIAELNQSLEPGLSPELLAAFISFLSATSDVCKASACWDRFSPAR